MCHGIIDEPKACVIYVNVFACVHTQASEAKLPEPCLILEPDHNLYR